MQIPKLWCIDGVAICTSMHCTYMCMYNSFLFEFMFAAQSPATFSVTNVRQGATATFECSYPSLTSPTTLDIYKDSVALYQCADIAFTCSKRNSDNDYSDVTFTDLGTASAKGTFTVANADQTRDGGEWACQYGSSLISSSVTFVVSGKCTHIHHNHRLSLSIFHRAIYYFQQFSSMKLPCMHKRLVPQNGE